MSFLEKPANTTLSEVLIQILSCPTVIPAPAPHTNTNVLLTCQKNPDFVFKSKQRDLGFRERGLRSSTWMTHGCSVAGVVTISFKDEAKGSRNVTLS